MSNGVRIIPPKPKKILFTGLGVLFGRNELLLFEGVSSVQNKKGVESLKVGDELTFKLTKAVQLSDKKKMWIGKGSKLKY